MPAGGQLPHRRLGGTASFSDDGVLQFTFAINLPWSRLEGRPAAKVERKSVHLRWRTLFQARGKHMDREDGLQNPPAPTIFVMLTNQKCRLYPYNALISTTAGFSPFAEAFRVQLSPAFLTMAITKPSFIFLGFTSKSSSV